MPKDIQNDKTGENVEISPVGSPTKNMSKNKEGFVKGQIVNENEYWDFIHKQSHEKQQQIKTSK